MTAVANSNFALALVSPEAFEAPGLSKTGKVNVAEMPKGFQDVR